MWSPRRSRLLLTFLPLRSTNKIRPGLPEFVSWILCRLKKSPPIGVLSAYPYLPAAFVQRSLYIPGRFVEPIVSASHICDRGLVARAIDGSIYYHQTRGEVSVRPLRSRWVWSRRCHSPPAAAQPTAGNPEPVPYGLDGGHLRSLVLRDRPIHRRGSDQLARRVLPLSAPPPFFRDGNP